MEPCLVATRHGREYKVLVDKDVYDKFKDTNWYLDKDGYVVTARPHGRLHRMILGLKQGEIADHINRDPLDNRRANLRMANLSSNQANRRPMGGRKYKGVCYDLKSTTKNKYRASCKKDGKLYYSPRVATLEEATKAYDELAKRLHGKFAYLNGGQGARTVS